VHRRLSVVIQRMKGRHSTPRRLGALVHSTGAAAITELLKELPPVDDLRARLVQVFGMLFMLVSAPNPVVSARNVLPSVRLPQVAVGRDALPIVMSVVCMSPLPRGVAGRPSGRQPPPEVIESGARRWRGGQADLLSPPPPGDPCLMFLGRLYQSRRDVLRQHNVRLVVAPPSAFGPWLHPFPLLPMTFPRTVLRAMMRMG
jgi:hypothetical protein